MPHWLIKWALHRTISVLPGRQRLNEVFQKHFSRTLELGAGMFESRLNDARTHLQNFLELRPGTEGFTAVELGSGWYPTMALGLFLCGAEEIWLFDIERLLRSERLLRLLDLFEDFDNKNRLAECLPRFQRKRLEQMMRDKDKLRTDAAEQWLERLNIHVMLRDARQCGLDAGVVDLFYSTVVLEYIPAEVLRGILKEFRRVGSKLAVMSHCIGFLDQFSFFDKALSPYNYLRYTESQWRLWSSPLIWQNRLVIANYRQLFVEAGFEIAKEASVRGSDADFDRVPLAPQFREYKREELMILRSWIVARPVSDKSP